MGDMTVLEHSTQVTEGLEKMANIFGEFATKVTKTQETHDMVIKLEEKMLNVERQLERILSQLDNLPSRLDDCYVRKDEHLAQTEKVKRIEERAADKADVRDLKKAVDGFKNYLIGFAGIIILSAVLVALGIIDKVHL